jgi:hypothetical protein
MRQLAMIPATVLLAGFLASPASAGLKDDYMAACMRASGDNTELCTCKTTEALKVADEQMLGYIILNMTDSRKFTAMVANGEVPQEVVAKWPFYVRDTNKVCLNPNQG